MGRYVATNPVAQIDFSPLSRGIAGGASALADAYMEKNRRAHEAKLLAEKRAYEEEQRRQKILAEREVYSGLAQAKGLVTPQEQPRTFSQQMPGVSSLGGEAPQFDRVPHGLQAGEGVPTGVPRYALDMPAQMSPQLQTAPPPMTMLTAPDGARVAPTAAPAAPAAPSGAVTHKVESGESISKIGQKYGVPWQNIAAANNIPIAQAGNIQAGQELTIPGVEPEPTPEMTVPESTADAIREAPEGAGDIENLPIPASQVQREVLPLLADEELDTASAQRLSRDLGYLKGLIEKNDEKNKTKMELLRRTAASGKLLKTPDSVVDELADAGAIYKKGLDLLEGLSNPKIRDAVGILDTAFRKFIRFTGVDDIMGFNKEDAWAFLEQSKLDQRMRTFVWEVLKMMQGSRPSDFDMKSYEDALDVVKNIANPQVSFGIMKGFIENSTRKLGFLTQYYADHPRHQDTLLVEMFDGMKNDFRTQAANMQKRFDENFKARIGFEAD
jgi:LysM repeat protein